MKAIFKFLPRLIRITWGLVSDPRFRDFLGLIVDKSGSKFPIQDRYKAVLEELEKYGVPVMSFNDQDRSGDK